MSDYLKTPNVEFPKSFSASMTDQMFDELNRQEIAKDDSSIAVVDLDALENDDQLFEIQSDIAMSPIFESPKPRMQELDNPLGQGASPIPLQTIFCADNTSLVHNTQKILNLDLQRAEESTSMSPIQTHNIVASTPFHSRAHPVNLQDNFLVPNISGANKTFNINERSIVDDHVGEKRQLNVTYNEKPKLINTTFATRMNPINDTTFNKDSPNDPVLNRINETFNKDSQVFSIPVSTRNNETSNQDLPVNQTSIPDCNQTFEVKDALDKIPEKGPSSSKSIEQLRPKTKPKDAEEPRGKTESKEENQVQSSRKPLSAINNATNARIKGTVPVNRKRLSKLQAPRLNAAAVSRIQANSPQKIADNTQSENVALLPSKSAPKITENRKLIPKSKIAGGRRSLLPPPSSKSRQSIVPVQKVSELTAPLPPSYKSTKKDPSCPKNSDTRKSVRRSSSETSFTKPSTSMSRPNSAKGLRIASSTNSQPSGSKLQKRTSSASALRVRSSQESLVKVGTKPRPNLSNQKHENIKSASSCDQKSSNRKPNQTSRCVVAMATLLDYVVNEVNGLSAPQLSRDKQRLLALTDEQKQSTDELTSRVKNLELALSESRELRERDAADLSKAHENESNKLKEEFRSNLEGLETELANTKQMFLDQEHEYDETMSELQREHREEIEELTSKHADALAVLEQKLTKQLDETRGEKRELEEKMNSEIEEKVEESIKPYLDSYEENKSLRAVMELKSKEHHKLLDELSRRCDQTDEARALKDLVISLQQKNEDLHTQLEDKASEHRLAKQESLQLQRQLTEQQKANNHLQLRVEELSYRLSKNTISPTPPFNPVFTQSPVSVKHSNGHGSCSGAMVFPEEKIKKKVRKIDDVTR